MTIITKEDVPKATLMNFSELFSDGRSFEIPDYQRAYEWGAVQRKDLFDDLDRLDDLITAGKASSHFCGTVICTPPNSTGKTFAVVDGQQRLTTLALIHARLANAVGRSTFLYSEGRMLLKPQSGDANRFGELLSNKKPGAADTIAQMNYINAGREIDTWIARDINRAERLLDHVERRLSFIYFVLRDETEVAKVFETINNRGKPLSQMDLVKNYLLYLSTIHDWTMFNVNEVWKDIQRIAASTQFVDGDMETVLRAVITAQFRPGRREADETDYSILVRNLPVLNPDRDTFETFLKFLETSFRTHEKMRKAHSSDPKAPITRALTFLNHHASVSGVLPLIFAREYRRNDPSGGKQEAKVLEAIEIANFRLYGLPRASARSDSHNVRLHRLAHDYFEQRKTDTDVIADLKALVKQSHKDGLSEIVRSLTLDDDNYYDFYRWPWLRYFLGRFEEHLRDSQSFDFSRLRRRIGKVGRTNDVLSIEHIWPKKAEEKIVGENNKGQQIRRLGNLMLLPHKVNIERSNGDLEFKTSKSAKSQAVLLKQNETSEKKAEKAKKFADHLSQRNDQRFGEDKTRFNKRTIKSNCTLVRIRTLCDLREEEMIRFALTAWRFPGEIGEGQVFEGMFSLPYDGETFLVDKEHAGNKTNENYVLGTKAKSGSNEPRALERLNARRGVTGFKMTPVAWD